MVRTGRVVPPSLLVFVVAIAFVALSLASARAQDVDAEARALVPGNQLFAVGITQVHNGKPIRHNAKETIKILSLSGPNLQIRLHLFQDFINPCPFCETTYSINLASVNITRKTDEFGKPDISLACPNNTMCLTPDKGTSSGVDIIMPNSRGAAELYALLKNAAATGSASNPGPSDNSAEEAAADIQRCQSDCRSRESDCRNEPDICEPEPTDVLCETPAQVSAQKVAQYAECTRQRSECMNDCAQAAEASHIPSVAAQAQQAAREQQQVSNAAQSQSQSALAAVAPPSAGEAMMQGLARGLAGAQAMQSPRPAPAYVPPAAIGAPRRAPNATSAPLPGGGRPASAGLRTVAGVNGCVSLHQQGGQMHVHNSCGYAVSFLVGQAGANATWDGFKLNANGDDEFGLGVLIHGAQLSWAVCPWPTAIRSLANTQWVPAEGNFECVVNP